MTVTADRVAVQAAVLCALRAAGADDVWPATPLDALSLGPDDRTAVAADLQRTLALDVEPDDMARGDTAAALIDLLADRAAQPRVAREVALA